MWLLRFIGWHVHKRHHKLHKPKSLSNPKPCKQGQAIVWACVRLDGKTIGVEVLGIENEQVWVQALPVVKEDGKLEPQFPFPDGSCSLQVKASDLEHIHIYQDA